jgi:hypothetical protein
MSINAIDPMRVTYYLDHHIDAVLASLLAQNTAFVMTVQSQDQEVRISHYSDATETLSAICRAVCELEAA